MPLLTLPSYDVLIAGGGPAGIAAAIAAARNGIRALLIERYGFLGGEAVTGLNIHGFFNLRGDQIVFGIAWEIIQRLMKMNAAAVMRNSDPYHPNARLTSLLDVSVDREAFKFVCQELLEKAGVQVLLHTWVSDVAMEGNAIRGLVCETKSGRMMISGRVCIDCTGDGDVAARSGAPYEKGRASDGLLQPMTLMFTMAGVDLGRMVDYMKMRRGEGVFPETGERNYMHFQATLAPWAEQMQAEGLFQNQTNWRRLLRFNGNSFRPGEVNILFMTPITGLDATDALQLSAAEMEGRRQAFLLSDFIRRHVPGFEKAYLLSTAAHVGVRETRRIIGEYYLTYDDVLAARQFKDVVALGGYFVDIHDPRGGPGAYLSPEKGVFSAQDQAYDIPYRCLLPLHTEQLLVAGRPISGSHEAHASYRVMATCMGTGQAAGTASAMAVRQGTGPRQVSVLELQRRLMEQGAYLRLAPPPELAPRVT